MDWTMDINGIKWILLQEFGSDDTPLQESEYTLPLIGRLKRSLINNSTKVKTILDQTMLDSIISRLNFTGLIFSL